MHDFFYLKIKEIICKATPASTLSSIWSRPKIKSSRSALEDARVALLQADEQVTDDPIFQHDALLFMVVHDPHNTGEIAVNARCSFQFHCAVAASKKSSRGTIIFDPPFTVQASQRFWLDIDENRSSARYLRSPKARNAPYRDLNFFFFTFYPSDKHQTSYTS